MIIKIKNEIINLPDNKIWQIFKDYSIEPYVDILNRRHEPYFNITIRVETQNEYYKFDSLEELERNYKELLENIKSKLF